MIAHKEQTNMYTKEQTHVYTLDGTLIPQYRLSKLVLIWLVTALPMGILGWVVAPALVNATHNPFARTAVLAVGLVWQFVLAMILVYQEAGNLRWSTIRQRLFLTTPRSPRTGKPSARLWWWLIPLILLSNHAIPLTIRRCREVQRLADRVGGANNRRRRYKQYEENVTRRGRRTRVIESYEERRDGYEKQ